MPVAAIVMSEAIEIQDREELLFLLCEAAEFEHTVMCTYLYAGWTLKREPDESCTAEELEAVERWRGSLRQVALEEMLQGEEEELHRATEVGI